MRTPLLIPPASGRYQNALLTVAVALLAVFTLNNLAAGPAPALAGDPGSGREFRSDRDRAARDRESADRERDRGERWDRADRGGERDPSGFPNASEQRNRMISALESLDRRMQRIEAALTGPPMKVKVVEMPEVKVVE